MLDAARYAGKRERWLRLGVEVITISGVGEGLHDMDPMPRVYLF